MSEPEHNAPATSPEAASSDSTPRGTLGANTPRIASRTAIRHATMADLNTIADAEARSFPPAEACPRESFAARLAAYPDHFWLLEVMPESQTSALPGTVASAHEEAAEVAASIGSTPIHTGAGASAPAASKASGSAPAGTPVPILASFVNGLVTEEPDLLDKMYDNPSFHDPLGSWQMIFGVVTVPEFRRRGYAAELLCRAIEDARAQGRAGLVLTCKDALIPYYARFGFVDEGLSTSTHGNVAWHQMRLTL